MNLDKLLDAHVGANPERAKLIRAALAPALAPAHARATRQKPAPEKPAGCAADLAPRAGGKPHAA